MKIGIIGGGISGISAAFWLSKKINSDAEIILLEKQESLGGSIDTVKNNGFTVEAGPNGFLDSKPYTLNLAKDAALYDNLLKSNDAARKRFIMRYGELQQLPESGGAFLKSKLLSTKGKLRLAKEFFIPRLNSDKDETVGDFARRRLGEEALDYMIGPMVSGIFAGDPDNMSLKSCFPVIYNLEKEYGGLIKALLKKRKKSSSAAGPGGILTSYKGGLINFINDLAEKCLENGVKILTDTEVSKILKKQDKFFVYTNNSDKLIFDKLIITSPAYSASKFLKTLNATLGEVLEKIPYSPIFVAGLGFEKEQVKHDLDGFGYLIPFRENQKILGALFTSSIFPERAPKNHKLIRVLMGGDRHRWIIDKTKDELLDIAVQSTYSVLMHDKNPMMTQTFKWKFAIPQYVVGHSKIVETAERISADIGNIFIGGNIFYGVGINDCTKTSMEIVDKVLKSM
jgi:oxygen-dependent protoporphyrinogen oxidase